MVRTEVSVSSAISCAVTGRRRRRRIWMMRNKRSARLMRQDHDDRLLTPCCQQHGSMTMPSDGGTNDDDVSRLRPRFWPAGPQPVCDEERSAAKDGGRAVQIRAQ